MKKLLPLKMVLRHCIDWIGKKFLSLLNRESQTVKTFINPTSFVKKVSTIGQRVKKARTMSGLTRKEMQNKYGINANTLQAWESDRNPLKKESIAELLNAFLAEGVSCSEEWLLTENGKPPFFTEIAEKKFKDSILSPDKRSTVELSEEEKILRESLFFSNHYSNSKIIVVSDDTMAPFYEKGDYVGGVLYQDTEIKQALGKDSIIVTKENEIFFRKFLENKKGYILAAINHSTREALPFIIRKDIVAVAPVVWHRKKISFATDE